MAEGRDPRRRQQSLFVQIAVRLASLATIFAILDVGIVLVTYAHDDQALAEDFIKQQAQQVNRTLGLPPHRARSPLCRAL